MQDARVHSLHYYPVKALAGHSPQDWTLEARGFKYDRRWMFVDAGGNFMSQRRYPQFVYWQASVLDQDLLIEDRRDPGIQFRIPGAARSNRREIEVTLWDDTFMVAWVDEPIVTALTSAMGLSGARLVYLGQEHLRPLDSRYAQAGEFVSLADGFPYLICNTASLDDANDRMGEALEMSRFRPNIVLETTTPWAEDQWTALQIGNARFRTPKPCARCRVITIDQQTGEQRIELLGELSRFRKVGGKTMFGVNGVWEGGAAEIRVGDAVARVESTGITSGK